jgi:two-component system, LytTR family, response regulator LytT
MKVEPIKVLVVEDDLLTSQLIRKALSNSNYKIIAVVKSAINALDILDTTVIDIAIVDIQIDGEKNGIWLGKKIQHHYKLPFIYLSAEKNKGQVELAINSKPCGYLIKPFNKTQLITSIELAISKYNSENFEQITKPKQTQDTDKWNTTIFIKSEQGHRSIRVSDILFIKSELKYIEIQTQERKYLIRYGLNEFLQILPKEYFFKVHRSYIVNVKRIEHIKSTFLEIADTQIPIGSKYREKLFESIIII